MAVLKKGQTPAGFKIEKESEKDIKSMPEVTGPQIIPPPPSASHVELGKLEKANPLPYASITPPLTASKAPPLVAPLFGLAKPTISIPSVSGILDRFKDRPDSKRIIIYAIVGIGGFIITAYLIPYFASLRTASDSPTPSATFTGAPTAPPVSLESFFSVSDSINIFFRGDPSITLLTQFYNSGKLDSLISSGEPGVYKVNNVDGTKRYGFAEFTDGMSAESPAELKSLTNDESLLLTFMPKSDSKISFGFIVKLQNVDKTAETFAILQNWENTMKRSLAEMLQFDQTKTASVGFLDNSYNGVTIRYINFPDPNLTVDYSVVRAKNGESYLVMVNSREHIYAIIDKLR